VRPTAPDTPPPYSAISLVLPTADGTFLDLADARGRALLVLCVLMDDLPSQAMLRELELLAREHPEDLRVVALVGDRHPPRLLRDLAQTFAQVVGLEHVSVALATDEVRAGLSPLGAIDHVPSLYLVNRAGVLSRRVNGVLTLGALRALVAPALPGG
jgi:hypothetical protein